MIHCHVLLHLLKNGIDVGRLCLWCNINPKSSNANQCALQRYSCGRSICHMQIIQSTFHGVWVSACLPVLIDLSLKMRPCHPLGTMPNSCLEKVWNVALCRFLILLRRTLQITQRFWRASPEWFDIFWTKDTMWPGQMRMFGGWRIPSLSLTDLPI